ncbi:MAG: ribonuclease P protein component [Marinilabiliales bacterium]|nr:ribonuclease P protein component [Marinilabiliales bacterium]
MEGLFLSGNSFLAYPVKVIWKLESELGTDYPAQAGFAVPKRIFKHAVDRNRIKRLMRESYRLHKTELYAALAGNERKLAVMFVYIAKEEFPFARIHQSFGKATAKLATGVAS